MKNCMKKITSVLMVLCLTLGMVAFSSGQSYAEGEVWTLGLPESLYTGELLWPLVYDENSEAIAEVTDMTASNAEILVADKATWVDEDGVEHADVLMVAKSAGTTTVTVNYTTPNGETGTLSQDVTVKKYPNMIKSLKVNGKKVTVSKHKYDYSKRTSKTSVSIKMALKNGWKINRVSATKWTKKGKYSNVKITKKMITKGSSIKFPKKYMSLNVSIEMKKGNSYIYYYVDFYR